MSVKENCGLIEMVPYNCLFLSSLNVRKDESDDGIRELAELIDAEGVVQSLSGYKEFRGTGKKKIEMTGVVAGGRRYRAVGVLIQEGRKPPDFPMPCLITTPERAIAISLAENSGRKSLHPADEFIAFRDLVNQGRTVEEVAAAYSVTPLVVQRRLRLANLSPDFIELYRKGAAKLDHLMALASTDDAERQKAAWAALPELQRTPAALRRVLTEYEVALSRPLARYVGLEAYQAAGGGVRTDLFADNLEDGTLLLDPVLVERLAREKLTAEAEVRRAGAGAWVEVSPRLDLADLAKYKIVRTVRRDPTPEEAARLEVIGCERDALEKRQFDLERGADESLTPEETEDELDMDSDEDGASNADGGEHTEDAISEYELIDRSGDAAELEAIARRIEELDREDEEINEALRIIDPAQAAYAGTLLSIGRKGEVCEHKGLLKPEDAARLASVAAEHVKAVRPARNNKAGESGAMLLRLSAHRTQALQAVLVDDKRVALAALCQRFVMDTILDEQDPIGALNIQVGITPLESHADDLATSPAYAKIKARREEWLAKIPGDPMAILPWLLEQPESTVTELLAFCATLSLDAVEAQSGAKHADELARAARLNMAEWWVPTAGGYLGKVTKDMIVQIVKKAVSPEEASRVERFKKKSDMAKAAEKVLASARWVPDYFRNTQLG